MSMDTEVRQQDFFAKVPFGLIEDERIGKNEMLVYLALSYHAGFTDHRCHPSVTTICERARLARATVTKALDNLIPQWVEAEKTQGKVTRYVLRARSVSEPVQPVNGGSSASERVPVQPVNTNESHLNENQRTRIHAPDGARSHHEPAGPGLIANGHDGSLFELQMPPSTNGKYPHGFEEWWKVYPRKVGKKLAAKKYEEALKEASEAQLLAGARQIATAVAEGEDRKYVPHPTTWLNQGRWDDEDPKTAQALPPPRRCWVCGDAEVDPDGEGVCDGCKSLVLPK